VVGARIKEQSMKRVLMFAVLALLVPLVASAESLGAAAKRESERREKNKQEGLKPVRVITQDDVTTNTDEKGSWNESASESNAESTATSGSGSSTSGSSGSDPKEGLWRGRAQAARSRLATAQKTLAKTPPMVTVAGITKAIPLSPDGRRLQEESTTPPSLVPNPAYAAAQAEVKAAEKAITDLEEEARRAGALPGWLR
jgi:hypothetical protein